MPRQTTPPSSLQPIDGQTFLTPSGDVDTVTKKPRRTPVEMIEGRHKTSAGCEKRIRQAVTKLVKTGAPFSVQNIIDLSGVGKTFIYDKRRPELTRAVLQARDAGLLR